MMVLAQDPGASSAEGMRSIEDMFMLRQVSGIAWSFLLTLLDSGQTFSR